MDTTKVYEELVRHLDQGVVGSPNSPALIEILKVLFPPDEAEIAVRLPMRETSLSKLKEIFPDKPDSLEDTLNRMVDRGTVYTTPQSGQEARYCLLPPVKGWFETPFWLGHENETTHKLAPLWLKYRTEAFGAELARNDMPIVRVIPVSKTIEDSRKVLPSDALRPMIEAASYRAVAYCPCRLIKKMTGNGCDHPLETCLHFGDMARHMVEHGMAREITTEETLKILQEANQAGLVHVCDNVQGHLGTICNCCGCACIFLETKKMMGLHTISTSNYAATVNSDLCESCGTCEQRCPMGAVSVDEDAAAVVDQNICIGCGVCTPTCPNEAIDLSLRGEIKTPPEVSEFLSARLKRS